MTSLKTSFIAPAIALLALSGCAQHHHHAGATPLTHWQTPQYQYKPIQTHKLLSDYTEKLAMDLIENMNHMSQDSKLAVASFVVLDNNLRTTNVLGNQLAESMINEMQTFGLTVIDYKLTNKIDVTSNGDFAFSRSSNKLSDKHVDYILTGTITYNHNGAIIHARLINSHTNIVNSSAKTFLPAFMIDSLYGDMRYVDGVRMPMTTSR